MDNATSYADVLRTLNMSEHGRNNNTLKKIIKEYDLDETKLNENREEFLRKQREKLHSSERIPIEEIIYENKHPTYNTNSLRNRLISEGYKVYKCERCGISSWQDKPLSLQLHHKDENKRNHYITNLELLCPNCHSQTEGYAGRKAKLKRDGGEHDRIDVYQKIRYTKKIPCPICGKEMSVSAKNMCLECHRKEQAKNIPPKEEIEKLIYNTPFTTIAKQYGVTDNAVRRWCKKYNLPFKSREIKEQNKQAV